MTNFNMGRLWLGKDGYYRDINGNKIAQKGQPISGAAWRYLASKYGRDYANRTSMNTRNGNIFQNGRWRFNDVESSKQGRTATWDEAASRVEENAKAAGARKTATGYLQKNEFDGNEWFLNQDTKDKAQQAFLKSQKNKWKPQQKKESDIWDKMGEDGLLAGALESAGVDPTLAQVGSIGAYFVPGVGSALAAGDAINSFAHGNIREGVMNTLFAIPGLGGALKLGSFGLRGLGKSAKLISKVNRFSKVGQISKPIGHANARLISTLTNPNFQRRLSKAGKIGLGAGLALGLGGLGYDVYKSVTDEE